MEFKLRYKYDGGQTCRPIGATVDSAATPVQLPVATDATIRIEMVSAWSRRVVRPAEDIHGATAWRFAVFDKYGDGMGMLFATRNVDVAESYWKVPWKDSGTKEMFAALGGEPARVFTAELQGYETQDSALPTAVFSFPFRVGNRRGDIVAISPIEQFEESDPVAMAALDAHATAGDAHTDIRDAIATHVTDDDNPHSVTAAQVGADAAGTAEAKVIEHNTDEAAHGDIRAAVSSAQQQADSALQNSIVAHNLAVTASSAVNAHNTSEDAHADIRAEKLDKENETTSLSLRQDDVGFIVADTAGAYHATFNPGGLVHNFPDSVNHTLSFPSKDGVLALTSDISDHTSNTDNPHSVTELQVSTATTERTDRAFIRADYNYEGRPWYVDAKVTDRVLFTADTTRIDYLFVSRKLQALYITGWGNAGGHLVLEGSGTDPYGLTLRTVGDTNNKPGIDINPASFTTIKGDLNIASRAAVTTGNWQKTESSGDLTADGTITAKTGMKVTKTDGETTTDVMSVDSTGMKVSATSVTEKGTTTGSMSVGSTGMKVSIGDGETTKDVVSVDSTGLTVDGKTTSSSVVSNSVSTNNLRVYTTGTDASKQYIDLKNGTIKCVHSPNLTIMGNDTGNSHNIVIGAQNYPISLRKGTTNLLVITTSGATFQVPIKAYREAEFISSISAPSFIEKDSVSIGGSNEVPDHFNYFGKFNYVIQWHNEEVTSANYVVDLFAGMDNGTVTLPEYGKTTSRYSIINCTTNTLNVTINFDLSSHWYDIEKGIVFLVPQYGEANFNTSLNRYNVASFDVCIEKLEGVYITPNVDGTGDVTTPLQAYTVRYTKLADCLNPGN